MIKSKWLKKALALTSAVALTAGLYVVLPSQAFAAETTVYVLTEESTDAGTTEQYTYDKNGLLKKAVANYENEDGGKGKDTQTYKYSGNNVTKITDVYKDGSNDFKLVHVNKYSDGKIQSTTVKSTEGGDLTTKFSYDKNGRISSFDAKGDDTVYSGTYTYNKKDQVVESSIVIDDQTTTEKVSYDKNGNISKLVIPDLGTSKTKYTYDKNGNPTSSVAKADDTIKATYTYKAIKVDDSYKEAIEKQQWALLNGYDFQHIFY